jgi:nitrite reductase (NADH) small subunit/3-phenylpropionate/trans-cinnamate dioxygenase ferredoxin subunit
MTKVDVWEQHERACALSPPAGEFVTVAKVESIPPGQSRVVVVGDRLIAIFHDRGQFHAISDVCPHMGASLGEGHLENGIVTCPWHGWRFRIADGTWCDNPCIKIDRFEVRVVGDEIQVCVDCPPRDPTRVE